MIFIFILILINSHFLEFNKFKLAFDLRLHIVNVILKSRNFDIFFDNFFFRACDSRLRAKLLKFDFHARLTFCYKSKNVEIVIFVCDSSKNKNVLNFENFANFFVWIDCFDVMCNHDVNCISNFFFEKLKFLKL